MTYDPNLDPNRPRPATEEIRRTTINANEARQGTAGRPVLAILGVALALALIVWGIAEFYGESTDNVAEQAPATETTPGTDQNQTGSIDNDTTVTPPAANPDTGTATPDANPVLPEGTQPGTTNQQPLTTP